MAKKEETPRTLLCYSTDNYDSWDAAAIDRAITVVKLPPDAGLLTAEQLDGVVGEVLQAAESCLHGDPILRWRLEQDDVG